MNPAGELRLVLLGDGRVSPLASVPAVVLRDFPAERLAEVEAGWAPARRELIARRAIADPLENAHWNWAGKAGRVANGELSLVGVECEGAVQGLMALPRRPRPSALRPGVSVVYIDYLEAAPWNQRAHDRPPRFLGVGTVLFAQAVILSEGLGLAGRVGLHSLPQAERFYAKTCGMTRVGPDESYFGLAYFEYPGTNSRTQPTPRTAS